MVKKRVLFFLVFAIGLFFVGCDNTKISIADLIEKVNQICNNQDLMYSSNPYDYIKAKQDVFDSIILEGDAAVKVFVDKIRNSETFGLDKYIMAAACAEITGIGKNGGWATAKEWLVLYDRESQTTTETTEYIGKYITTDIVNMYSSYLPELEFLEDGTFTLSTSINCYMKGMYKLTDDHIALTVTENTTQFDDSYVESMVLRIKSDNMLVLSIELPEVTKASAVFQKLINTPDTNERKINSTLSICGSKDGVKEFLALQRQLKGEDLTAGYEFSYDTCYNVTPKEVSEKSNCQIFKYSESCDSFLLYEGKIYKLGESFGGLGIVDVKVCDFDKNGVYEVLYTYSYGSGLHRSHVGHFDLKAKRQTELDYVYMNEDMMIVENFDESFSLYHANVEWGEVGLIDFDLTAGKFLADIVYKNGKLNVLQKK